MNFFVGVLLIIISATSFAMLPIFAKLAYQENISLLGMLFVRFFLGTLIMLVILFIRRCRMPRGADFFKLLAIGAFCYVGQSITYFGALRYIQASLATIFLYTYPVIVTVMGILFFREKFTWIKFFVLFLAMCGVVLTVGVNNLDANLTGILLAFAAGVIYSIYVVTGGTVLRRVEPIAATTVILMGAAVVYGAAFIVKRPPLPTTFFGWSLVIALCVICGVISTLTFFAGMRRIGATNAAIFSTLEPVLTILFAVWLLHDQIGYIQAIGASAVIIAVFIKAFDRERESPENYHKIELENNL